MSFVLSFSLMGNCMCMNKIVLHIFSKKSS